MRSSIGCVPIVMGVFALLLNAQTGVDLQRQGRNVNFTEATSTKPVKTGTSLPVSCSVGEMYLKTDGPAGSNLFACVSGNAWSMQSGGFPAPGGNAGRVLSSDGGSAQWSELKGDLIGAIDAVQVSGLRGRSVSGTMPSEGDGLRWNSSNNQWEPGGVGAYQAGTGINIVGQTLFVEDGVIPEYSTGAGIPASPCTLGREFYLNTTDGTLYYCAETNIWRTLLAAAHVHNAGEITGGILDNARTSGSSANSAGTLVLRDTGGNFSAATITASLDGNAATATALAAIPGTCGAGQAANGVDARGNANCFTPSLSTLSDGGAAARIDTANSFSAGTRQRMQPSASVAGLSIAPGALPASPIAGDVAIDANAANTLKWYTGIAWQAAEGNGGSVNNYYTSAAKTGIGPTAFTPTGTLDVIDKTATTGFTLVQFGTDGTNVSAANTKVVVRNGSSQNINPVEIQNAAGTVVLSVNQYGGATASNHFSATGGYGFKGSLLHMPSGGSVLWSSNTSFDGTKDVGLRRSGGGVLEIHDGITAGTYRDVLARSYRLNPNSDVRPACDATQRGKVWQTYGAAGVADTVAVCAKDSGDAYIWRTIY